MADVGNTVGWVAGSVGVVAAFFTALSSFRKTGPEKTSLLVDAASDVVVVQQGAMDRLQARLEKAEEVIDGLRFIQSEVESLRLELAEVRTENESLKKQLVAARKRIKQLEENGK